MNVEDVVKWFALLFSILMIILLLFIAWIFEEKFILVISILMIVLGISLLVILIFELLERDERISVFEKK